jgi:hypothetical protein
LTTLRHHSSVGGIVTTLVFTHENIVKFVALAVDKERAEAVVTTPGDLVFESSVGVLRDFRIELGDSNENISNCASLSFWFGGCIKKRDF